MKPTMELRWIERRTLKEEKAMGGDYYRTYIETEKVLQQKWIDPSYPEHPTWADVPTEIV